LHCNLWENISGPRPAGMSSFLQSGWRAKTQDDRKIVTDDTPPETHRILEE
jgi:hypothetical protein